MAERDGLRRTGVGGPRHHRRGVLSAALDQRDLYVRIGLAPTTTKYDCRPYKTGSNETCDVTLAQPAPIHVMVRGYATSSTFELSGHAVH